jgi:tetratricopeptide (TPR) repeat protein
MMPTEAPTASRPRRRRSHRLERSRGVAAVLAIVLLSLVAAAPGQAARKAAHGVVSGTVTSRVTGEPLDSVEITLTAADGTQETASTDRQGKFKLKVPAGDYLMGLARDGYAPFEASLTVAAKSRPVITVELLDASAGRRSAAVEAYNVGGAALRAGDTEAAKASFLAAVEADPTLPEPYLVLAGIYSDEGGWAEAAEAAETFLAARPEDPQAQRAAYEAHRKLGNAERVVELRASLAADPELAPKLAVHAFNEGAVATKEGDPATAQSRFEEALALDSGLAVAHFGLATLEFEAERYAEALAVAESGLALEPGSAPGRRLVFLIQEATGDDEAVAAALAAYAAADAPAVGEIFFKRGEAAFDAGNYPAAIKALTTVVAHQPDHASAHRLLGLSYLSSDTETAKGHLRRFLELAPGDSEAATVEEILASL